MGKVERQAASDAAQASVKLEGFVVPEDTLTEAQNYINGAFDLDELIRRLYRQAQVVF
ncbi:hypothetical protein [Alcaligenes sp. EGD-AK7]|uniref:antitoxin VbhA family protein n=1 Tax=Alcaligenes TaxID=507 RepID=UPI00137AC18A|nr:hypothetical protein [Alcaligenes sp. EGD-AK7]